MEIQFMKLIWGLLNLRQVIKCVDFLPSFLAQVLFLFSRTSEDYFWKSNFLFSFDVTFFSIVSMVTVKKTKLIMAPHVCATFHRSKILNILFSSDNNQNLSLCGGQELKKYHATKNMSFNAPFRCFGWRLVTLRSYTRWKYG